MIHPLLVDADAAAAIMGISVDEVLARVEAGTLPHAWIGKTKRSKGLLRFPVSRLPLVAASASTVSRCPSCGKPREATEERCWACQQTALREAREQASYRALYVEQQGKCAICGKKARVLAIDHDHATGFVRGLLCSQCNTGMGQFHDDAALLEAARRYLSENTVTARRITYRAMATNRQYDPTHQRHLAYLHRKKESKRAKSQNSAL